MQLQKLCEKINAKSRGGYAEGKDRIAQENVRRAHWKEETGFLDFLSNVYAKVARFDSTFDFGIVPLASPPESIDENRGLMGNIGFVVIRRNSVLIGRDYCLYPVLRGRVGYIGVYADGVIETVRELKPMTEFRNGTVMLHEWLRDLFKASCEKI